MQSAPCMPAARLVVRELPGRGRGLLAVGDVAPGEQLATFAAYSHTCDTRASECSSTSQCCATCLRWGVGLPVRCSGCPAAYCSPECHAAADLRGHQLCCAALQRIHAIRPKRKPKYSQEERNTACFLLRAFAQRASERQRAAAAERGSEGAAAGEGGRGGEGGDGGEPCGGEPCFEDAMAQEEETEHTAEERSSQERAVQLAKLQAAGLIDVPAALHLLRVAARNQFHLFDEEERARGSVMYPQASMINHSCVPNCAMTARGRHLVLEAISEVRDRDVGT